MTYITSTDKGLEPCNGKIGQDGRCEKCCDVSQSTSAYCTRLTPKAVENKPSSLEVVKGNHWVKASERLPIQSGFANKVIIKWHGLVAFGFKNYDEVNPRMYFEYGNQSELTNEDVLWLDESSISEPSATENSAQVESQYDLLMDLLRMKSVLGYDHADILNVFTITRKGEAKQ